MSERTDRYIQWILHGLTIVTLIAGLTWGLAFAQADINALKVGAAEVKIELKELHSADRNHDQQLSDNKQSAAVLDARLSAIQITLDRIYQKLESNPK